VRNFLRSHTGSTGGDGKDSGEEPSESVRARQLVRAVEDQGHGWFWQTDRNGCLAYLSSKVSAVFEAGGITALGTPLTDLFQLDTGSPDTERTLSFHLTSRTSFSDYAVRSASGSIDRWWSISGRPEIDALGRFQGFSGSGSDLTEKRRSDAEIAKLAMFDSLTGLSNRQRMRTAVEKSLAQSRERYRPFALFLLDLDRFKAVNDTLGHQAGDLLLKQVGQRLERAIGADGLVGRLGGDEFEILLTQDAGQQKLAEAAAAVIAALSHPYFIHGTSVSIGCSVGIARSSADGADADTLVRNCDLALYAAKAAGRGTYRFYHEDMLEGARLRRQLEEDMRVALNQGQFRVAYQAVVSTQTERIVGYEALIRWNHPERGPVSPAEFIPIAEECGLINQIGEWVLRTACQDAVGWHEDIRVAVNVSAIQFAHPALPSIVASALGSAGLSPSRLELEITEGIFVQESAATEFMFKSLKGLGVRLALDDFGTGYSSLGYLRKAPFDKIKIDQSFIRGATDPATGLAAIIKAIVTLADNLGMETTAEGVELQDEIPFIRGLGCTNIQGFVYGAATGAQEVLEQLAAMGGLPTPVGHKTGRSPRSRMLRSAALVIGGVPHDVRIRNISANGAMIEGLHLSPSHSDRHVTIEVVAGQPIPAEIRWSRDGQTGLQFERSLDLEALNAPPSRLRAAMARQSMLRTPAGR
jgi:diguanylate cyclase (GGDEF)-like protein